MVVLQSFLRNSEDVSGVSLPQVANMGLLSSIPSGPGSKRVFGLVSVRNQRQHAVRFSQCGYLSMQLPLGPRSVARRALNAPSCQLGTMGGDRFCARLLKGGMGCDPLAGVD